MKRISIDPITRLEGHGKIEIFLNETGNAANAYMIIPELRGFEKFCEGRKAEDMPILTTRICGVCPVAHHMASAKALDMAFNSDPPITAKKLRELMYCAYIIYDHILHFYFLGGPDFITGPDTPAAQRNILGVIKKAGLEVGKEVIKHRAYGQRITALLGGKATHPVCGIPGGVTKALNLEDRVTIENMTKSCVEFSKFSLELFDKIVLKNEAYVELINDEIYTIRTHYMGLVDKENKVNFYDGKVRVVDPEGKEFVKFAPKEYLDVVEERVEPWTYVKFPYLKKVGWKGFIDGNESGIYRVGPLGRLNASDGMSTPLAQSEFERMYKTLDGKPIHSTLAFHWARLIELLYASERALELIQDDEIIGTEVRNPVDTPTEGVGIVEAARGTLIHHYILDKDALLKKVNLIVATTNNSAAINLSIRDAAKGLIKDGVVNDALLNRIEMAFRAYDPCMACATHFALGTKPFRIYIYDNERNLIRTIPK